MIENIRAVLCDDEGAAVVEYALAASIMTAVMLAGVSVITANLTGTVNDLASTLNLNQVAGY